MSPQEHIADVDKALGAARDSLRDMSRATADVEAAIDKVHRALEAFRARHEED